MYPVVVLVGLRLNENYKQHKILHLVSLYAIAKNNNIATTA